MMKSILSATLLTAFLLFISAFTSPIHESAEIAEVDLAKFYLKSLAATQASTSTSTSTYADTKPTPSFNSREDTGSPPNIISQLNVAAKVDILSATSEKPTAYGGTRNETYKKFESVPVEERQISPRPHFRKFKTKPPVLYCPHCRAEDQDVEKRSSDSTESDSYWETPEGIERKKHHAHHRWGKVETIAKRTTNSIESASCWEGPEGIERKQRQEHHRRAEDDDL
jgi:hypothetical protein